MNDKIVEHLKNVGIHADKLMQIPVGERSIGTIQAITSIAILEIKMLIEEILNEWSLK